MITSTLTLSELKSAIIREPLVVSADISVMHAIALMSSGRSQCDAENHSNIHQHQFQQEARSSCVFVLEDQQVIGIMTERDVVRLSAQQQDLNRLLVREVMAHPVVTLRESDLTDLFLAVNLLQQHHIRHLPLLDDRGLLVGMVTHESLRQISRPIDLMRLRLVSEVMTPDVVCAAPNQSMLEIAQMMAGQKISSVMIVETCSTDASLQIPVGIVTERDVVQFQALGLNLETCIAHTVMSTPIFAVKPEDNLLTVQQIMEQRLIRRLAVTGEFGELLGIITQTSLLQALNPTEIYNLAKVLEAKVVQLEAEKVTLLEHRNIDLERQVTERTASLLEAEKALQKLNQSLELTVQERTQELWQVNKLQGAILDSADYAIISTDLNGIIQTFNAGAEKMLGYSVEEVIGKITPEIFFDSQELFDRTSGISIEAKQNNWGFGSLMLMATQGIHSDEWINIRKDGSRIPVEISVTAIKDDDGKTIGFLSIKKDISDRKQAEKALKESERLFSTLVSTSPVAITRFDLCPLNCIYVNERWCEMTGRSAASAMGRGWLDAVHPDERDMIRGLTEHEFFSPLSRQFMLTGEGRHLRPDGTINWYFSQLVKEFNESGEATGYIGTLTDISDRKQAELALAQKEQQFQELANASPSVIYSIVQVLNGVPYFEYISPAAEKIHGLTVAEAYQNPAIIFEQMHPDDLQGYGDAIEQSLKTLQPFSYEWRIITNSGTKWLRGNSLPSRRKNGDVVWHGVVTEISDRKQVELELQKTTERLALALKSGAIGYWEWDVQQNIGFWDDRMYELYGLCKETDSQIVCEIWANSLHPDDRAANELLLQQIATGQIDEYDTEFRVVYPDGSIHFNKAYGALKRDASGNPLSITGINFDISDRKQAEIALKSSEDRFRRVFDSSVVGMLFADFQGHITDANDRFLEMVGYTREDFQSGAIDWLAMTPPEHLEKDYACMEYLIKHRQIDPWEKEYYRKDGSRISILIGAALLQATNNESICVVLDISDRKQSEARLQLANEELMRATRLKDEFLANMSHELRTPLNSILGMNEALQEEVFGSINERQLKALQTIENSSTHLLTLINDILDVAKIESGQVTLDLSVTNIERLCKSSLSFIKQQALTKRIQLIHRIPKYLPEIMLDETRIRQVLINLLNNAVKFTLERGTITLEVSQVHLERSTTNLTPLNYLKIAVIDTGIGISAENIQKLFQPFIQIDSALNRQYNGTGLGLALVRRLVELHGGTVELTSEVGVGSCFAINLPINVGSSEIEEQTNSDLSGQPQIDQSETEGLISPLILLAEDNEANIATFSSYLEAKGYRILLATDGQQAIDLAKAHHPDLILMDIQMPGVDGIEAIKQIRLDPNLVDIPIIALTALAMAGDREKCLAAGANEYLPKPIKLKQLDTSIQQVLSAEKN